MTAEAAASSTMVFNHGGSVIGTNARWRCILLRMRMVWGWCGGPETLGLRSAAASGGWIPVVSVKGLPGFCGGCCEMGWQPQHSVRWRLCY